MPGLATPLMIVNSNKSNHNPPEVHWYYIGGFILTGVGFIIKGEGVTLGALAALLASSACEVWSCIHVGFRIIECTYSPPQVDGIWNCPISS